MSNVQTQAAAQAAAIPPPSKILRVDLLEVVSVADATSQSFATDMSALGAAKAATGFRVEAVRLGPDCMPVALKAGETWDGLRLSKSVHDRIKNVRVLHSAFIPKSNVREIVFAPE